jgi:DNA-binding transcriptional ArsR family regulator
MSRGWALGSREFKETLLRDHALVADSRAWESLGKEEQRRLRWEHELAAGRKALGRAAEELSGGATAQPWKIALMVWVKERTQASNPWLGEKFSARAKYVSKLAAAGRRQRVVSRELAVLRGKGAT